MLHHKCYLFGLCHDLDESVDFPPEGCLESDIKNAASTDPNICYNIMLYNYCIINGKRIGDLWKYKRPEYLTLQQLELVLQQIDLQKDGDGTFNGSVEDYNEYWEDNRPGVPLIIKKNN